MPDGDVVHYYPDRSEYRAAFEQLDEGQPTAEIALTVMKGLVRDMRKYDDEPLKILEITSQLIETSRSTGSPLDLAACSESIDQESLGTLGHRRAMPLAVDACKDCLFKVSGLGTASFNQIVEAYVWRVYDANFAERLPLYQQSRLSQREMDNRLQNLRQDVAPHVERIVQQVIKHGTVAKLKKLSRKEALVSYDSGGGKHNTYDMLDN